MLPENKYEDILEAKNGSKEMMTSLVKNNMGLVYNITKRFQGRGYENEELNQIGAIGLIKAIKNFNLDYNVKLSTYCVPYILGEIKKFIRDDGKIKVSRSIKELGAKINAIKKEYLEKEGKEIKVEKIAQILKISKEDVAEALDATSSSLVTSINESIKESREGKNIEIVELLANDKNEENQIINKLMIEKLINELEERDKKIIILRYFKGNTQTQVSKKLGISQVQVSRIEKRILYKMREKLA